MIKVAVSALFASALLIACSDSNSNDGLPDGRVHVDAQIDTDAVPTAKTLVRIDPELPGANCPAGGSAVHVGQDLNGDGILEDSEIQSTSYICTPPNPSTIEGSIAINNSVDAATLVGVTTITGNLVISAPGLDSIDLSSIQTLGGSFTVTGFSGTQLTAGFVTIGGDIDIENIPTLADVDLPQLTTVTGSFIFDGDATLATLTAPLLTSVGDNFYVGDTSNGAGAGAGFAFRAVSGRSGSPLSPTNSRLAAQTVGNPALVALSFPQLATVGSQLSIGLNSSLTTVSLPSLTSVSESLDANILSQFQSGFDPAHVPGILRNESIDSLDLSALVTVGNTIKIQDTLLTSLDLSSLTTVGGTLDIGLNESLAAIDFSSLTTVSAISCGQNCSIGGGIFIHDEAALSSVELPALVTVDLGVESLQLANDDALTTLGVPVLTTAGFIQVSSLPLLASLDLSSVVTVGGVSADSDPVLTAIDLSNATEIGDLDVESDAVLSSIDLSSVTTIDNDLTVESNAILTTLSAPALTSVGTSVIINNSSALTTFEVPKLASFFSFQMDDTDPLLTEISFPDLTLVTGGFAVESDPFLSSLLLPQLTSVGFTPGSTQQNGELDIEGNAALTALNLTSLTTTVALEINQNSVLTTLTVPALQNVAGELRLNNDFDVVSLAMPSLVSVGNLILENDHAMTSVTASASARASQFTAVNNGSLPTCLLQALATSLQVEADIEDDGTQSCGG